MQVTYQLTAEDFRQGILSHYSKRFIFRMTLSVAVLLIAAETLLWAILPDRRLVLDIFPVAVFAAFCIAFYWLCPYYLARKQFTGSPSAKLTINLEASEDRLHFKTEESDSSASWRSFVKWRERKSVFVLFTSPVVFFVFPKRAFTAEQIEEFREMLKRNIPAKK
jgi:hypothetical protein